MHASGDSFVVVTGRRPEAHLGLSKRTVLPRHFAPWRLVGGPGVTHRLWNIADFARLEHAAEEALIDRLVHFILHPDVTLRRSNCIHRDV